MDNMQLKAAPVIIDQFRGRSYPFAVVMNAAARVRSEWQNAPMEGPDADAGGVPDGQRLRRVAGDIWAINDSAVGLHHDKTAPRHRVFGVVLVNDPGLMLYQNQMVWDLPVGTIYHIDGRRSHGAIERNEQRTGLFAFLAWDVPAVTPLSELIADVIPSLEAYAKGEERVNILP